MNEEHAMLIMTAAMVRIIDVTRMYVAINMTCTANMVHIMMAIVTCLHDDKNDDDPSSASRVPPQGTTYSL